MKQKVSPLAAVVAIVVVALIAFGLVYMNASKSPQGSQAGQATAGMPADAAAEMQKRLGGSTTGPPPGTDPSTTGGIQGMGTPPGMGAPAGR